MNANWTYLGYWNAVLGGRTAARVVAEFELTETGRPLEEWLSGAEIEAASQGGIDVPPEWEGFFKKTVTALEEAIEEANEA